MTLSLPQVGLDTVLSGERNRGIEGRGFNVGMNVRPSTCLDKGGGEGDCGRSRIARVDSLLRAIFLSDGGGGKCRSSSGGVSDEWASWTGCGLNVASFISVTSWSIVNMTYRLSLPFISSTRYIH
jgi:hypothetical protein